MTQYKSIKNYQHGSGESLGILVTNLGTPEEPTVSSVRRYLAEFLSDPRVVEIWRPLWWLILHGYILRTRPYQSVKLYEKIWTEAGSPLRVTLDEQAEELQARLQQRFSGRVHVIAAMRYGTPSIAEGLAQLQTLQVRRLLLFPLFPQYSATTTATTFDAVAAVLKQWRWQPEFRVINHYADHEGYINAVAQSIKNYWEQQGQTDKLIFSFHGLPKVFLERGDPYHCYCQKTARLIAEVLQLPQDRWLVSFQSRLGRAEWLKPYTIDLMRKLPTQGIKKITVVCPGFSADCLETLEEIDQLNREVFLQSGGETFQYVPALNASHEHIDVLVDLIETHCEGWPEAEPRWTRHVDTKEREISRRRALQMGAKNNV